MQTIADIHGMVHHICQLDYEMFGSAKSNDGTVTVTLPGRHELGSGPEVTVVHSCGRRRYYKSIDEAYKDTKWLLWQTQDQYREWVENGKKDVWE